VAGGQVATREERVEAGGGVDGSGLGAVVCERKCGRGQPRAHTYSANLRRPEARIWPS
jgi:hypothetical protein